MQGVFWVESRGFGTCLDRQKDEKERRYTCTLMCSDWMTDWVVGDAINQDRTNTCRTNRLSGKDVEIVIWNIEGDMSKRHLDIWV